jgi:hypothetical protein
MLTAPTVLEDLAAPAINLTELLAEMKERQAEGCLVARTGGRSALVALEQGEVTGVYLSWGEGAPGQVLDAQELLSEAGARLDVHASLAPRGDVIAWAPRLVERDHDVPAAMVRDDDIHMRIRAIPEGVVVFKDMESGLVDMARLVESLETEGFEGMLRFTAEGTSGVLLWKGGLPFYACFHGRYGSYTDRAALDQMARQSTALGGIIDVHRMEPALTERLRLLLDGQSLHRRLNTRFVDAVEMLKALGEEGLSGVAVLGPPSPTTLVFMVDGDQWGYFTGGSKMEPGEPPADVLTREASLDVFVISGELAAVGDTIPTSGLELPPVTPAA